MKDLIKTIRTKLNLNQEQLASLMGVSPVTVNRWENGKANPSLMAQKQLYEICAGHQLDLAEYASTYTTNEDGNVVISEEESITFQVRYCPELASVTSTGYRILFHDTVYNIRSVDRMNYWGKGQERKNRLTAAGYDYTAVQKRVNELMRK